MRRTLLLIPHEIAGIPIFGLGWLLGLIVLALIVRFWFAKRQGHSCATVLGNEGVLWGLAAAGILFVLPRVELSNVDGDPVGLAVRGYGVMLLTGVGTAVALAAFRAKRRGLNPDLIYTLAPWAFFGGIGGARLFYVVQYRDQFFYGSAIESLGRVLKFTEGGLVVYGSFIGGSLAVAYFLLKHKMPILKFGDVIVPCMFLGVFFGRIGCLMNGCCYGGRCEEGPMAVRFPPQAKVYSDQIRSGELLGFRYDELNREIVSVRDDSLADEAGIVAGMRLQDLGPDYSSLENADRSIPAEDVQAGAFVSVDNRRIRWTPDELPQRSLPVRAAQVISSVSSIALCVLLCAISSIKLREGTVMVMGFASYAILRFVLEIVRVDEAGQFGTALSISQWVSVAVLVASVAGLAWIYRPGAPAVASANAPPPASPPTSVAS